MKLFKRLLVAPAALGLMAPVAVNADTAFSSTTIISGEAVFTTGSVAAGTGDANEELYMQYAYSLDLNSSFTGEDRLYAGIEAGNASGPLNTQPTAIDSATAGGNALTVSSLYYSFPVGDLGVTGGPLLDTDDVIAATTSQYSDGFIASSLPFSTAEYTGPGIAIDYATDNGLVASASLVSIGGANSAQGINTDTGNDVTTLSVGYNGDGFGGGLVLASYDGDIAGTVFGTTTNTPKYDTIGGGLYYSPESLPATFSVSYDTIDPSVGADATSLLVGADWEVGPGTLHVAYQNADIDDNSDNTDTKGYEVAYTYPVNDSVTVMPGIFSVEETNGTNDDSGVIVETKFSF